MGLTRGQCPSRALLMLLIGAALTVSSVSSQSNYATHGNNVGYLGEGLPEEATLDGKVLA